MLERRRTIRTEAPFGSELARGLSGYSDDSLVSRARSGSQDAFGELARRYRPAAVRTAASIIGTERAEDVVQDALILAHRALGMLQDPRRFPQWLGTITRYRALRLGRKESRRAAGLVALEVLPFEPAGRVADSRDEETTGVARLEAALLQIPEAFSRVLRLHFLEGLPHKRIAEKLDISLSTSKWRCYRGKQLLRELLSADDPGVARVERACDRCRARSCGVACEELAAEAGEGPELPRAKDPKADGRGRRTRDPHRLPTFHDVPTP